MCADVVENFSYVGRSSITSKMVRWISLTEGTFGSVGL